MTTEYYSIQNEIQEMSNLLKSIQKQSSSLLDNTEYKDISNTVKSTTNIKKVLNLQQKREFSSSAWAKSATKKETLLNKHKVVQNNNFNDNQLPLKTNTEKNLIQVEKYIKTRPPEYTIGKRYNTIIDSLPNEDIKVSPGDYDVNIEVLSTKKRSRTSTFSTMPRPFTNITNTTVSDMIEDNDPINNDLNQNDNIDDQSSDIVGTTSEDKNKVVKTSILSSSKGIYSFNKEKRFSTDTNISNDLNIVSSEMLIDIDKAEKAVLPNAHGGYVMKPPVYNKPANNTTTTTQQESNTANHMKGVAQMIPKPLIIGEPHLDKIAYRTRVQNVTTMQPSSTYNRVAVTKSVDLGTPGPGAYNTSLNEEMLSTYKRPATPTICYPVTKLKNEEALQWKIKHTQDVSSKLGPGLYHSEKGMDFIASKAPVIQVYKADSKPTIQLERKNYFEQKAKDMREVHDFMRTTNLSQVTSRTPQVQLAPPKTIESDPRRHKILIEYKTKHLSKRRSSSADPIKRRKSNIFDESFDRSSINLKSSKGKESEDELHLSYDRRYSLIEKKVTHGVKMKEEVTARKSTDQYIRAHPGVVARIADKQLDSLASHRHYGPQLPVQWTSESNRNRRNKYDDSDGYESPTEEVNRILAERNNNVLKDSNSLKSMETEYTKAYLKSSYSGTLIPKGPTILMDKPKTESLKRYIVDSNDPNDLEFIGPQLQPDWIKESEKRDVKYKSQAIKMDLVPGREKIKLHQKGVVEVIDFASKIIPEDIMGPGYYDANSHLLIANSENNKGVVPFSKAISRVDQMGAYGEKPEAILSELAKLDKDNMDLYINDQVDIDYSRAKDANTGTNRGQFRLYTKDRYPVSKKQAESPLDDHLGGSWFEGIGEQVNNKLKTNQLKALDFSKQTGRAQINAEEDLRVLLEEDIGPIEGNLNIEVKDWHPNKPNKQTSGYVMQDPKIYPRFKEPKTNDNEKSKSNNSNDEDNDDHDQINDLPPLINYPLNDKRGNLINMSKMRGREDINTIADPAVLMAELEGEQIDSLITKNISSIRDKALDKASTLMSGYKRTVQPVSMNKQQSRMLSTLEATTTDAEELLHQMNNKNLEQTQNQSNKFRNIPELTAPALKNPKDIQKSGDGIGARDWNLIPGRNNNNAIEESKIVGTDVLPHEELDLNPEIVGTSKHKKLIGLTNWDKEKNLPRFPNKTEEENQILDPTEQLDLKDVDPGKFKKGMHGFSTDKQTTTGLSTMANQPGRPVSDLEHYTNMQKVGLLSEELVLNTDNKMNALKPSNPSTLLGNRDHRNDIENTRLGKKVMNELRQDHEEILKLNPSQGINYLDKHIPSGTTMQNKAILGATKHDVNEEKDFRSTHNEELILNPIDNKDMKANTNKTTVSMLSKTNDDRKSMNEIKAQQNIDRNVLDVLKLNPTDEAIKNRIPGSSLMKSNNQLLSTSKQELAKKTFDKEYNEEVIVASNNNELLKASRVQSSNAVTSSMSNKTLRISTSNAELAVEKDLLKEKEELVLNPKNPRVIIKTNTTNNNNNNVTNIATNSRTTNVLASTNKSSNVNPTSLNNDNNSKTSNVKNKAITSNNNNSKNKTTTTTPKNPSSLKKESTTTTSSIKNNKNNISSKNNLPTTTINVNDVADTPNTPKIIIPDLIHKAPPNLSTSYNGNIEQYKNLNEDEMINIIDSKLNNLNI